MQSRRLIYRTITDVVRPLRISGQMHANYCIAMTKGPLPPRDTGRSTPVPRRRQPRLTCCAGQADTPIRRRSLRGQMPAGADGSPPICKEDEQVRDADGAVLVQISGTVIAVDAWTPISEQNEEVAHADRAIAVDIAGNAVRR